MLFSKNNFKNSKIFSHAVRHMSRGEVDPESLHLFNISTSQVYNTITVLNCRYNKLCRMSVDVFFLKVFSNNYEDDEIDAQTKMLIF